MIAALTRIFAQAHQAGALRDHDLPTGPGTGGALAADMQTARAEMALDLPDHLLARGVLVWAALFGAVNFEVFGQYGPDTFSEVGS